MKHNSYSKLVVVLFLTASLFALTYTFWKSELILQGEYRVLYNKYYWISLGGVSYSLVLLFLSKELQLNLTIATSVVFATLLIGEIVINFTPWSLPSQRTITDIPALAEKQGVIFDKRSLTEVLQELTVDGFNPVPALHHHTIYFETNGEMRRSLTGVSNRTTVYCNEAGYWSIYTSDRYGFNNPDEVWANPEVEGLLIGDSYTQGACVHPGKDVAGQLRRLTNKTFVNLGVGGTGPLHQFAVFSEYSPNLDPKKVFWLYFEQNDLNNLADELQDPSLVTYLNEGYTTSLKDYQQEIDLTLLQKIEEAKTSSNMRSGLRRSGLAEVKSNTLIVDIKRIVTLGSLRRATGFNEIGRQLLSDQKATELLTVLRNILEKAKARSTKFSGKLYFVYLPDFDRYSKLYVNHDKLYRRQEVLNLVQGLEIPIIDIHKEVFANTWDAKQFFPFGIKGHYTTVGYKRVAETIKESVYLN